MRLHIILATAILLEVSTTGSTVTGPARELRMVPYYSVEAGSHWLTAPHPTMLRRPTIETLAAAAGGKPMPDFGISFDCAIKATGAVEDCRSMVSVTAGVDVAAMIARLASAIRLDSTSIERAKAEG